MPILMSGHHRRWRSTCRGLWALKIHSCGRGRRQTEVVSVKASADCTEGGMTLQGFPEQAKSVRPWFCPVTQSLEVSFPEKASWTWAKWLWKSLETELQGLPANSTLRSQRAKCLIFEGRSEQAHCNIHTLVVLGQILFTGAFLNLAIWLTQ